MADVEVATTEGKVISKTTETTVNEDGTTVTEENIVIAVNGDHKKYSETTTTEVVDEMKHVENAPKETPGENGQVAKDEPAAVEEESSAADAVVVEGAAATTEATPEETKEEPTPKVILHQFPPGKNIPSASNFCLKLETFLRLNKIPYENQYGYKMGKKGKMPWIEYQGERKADSNVIINFLNEKFEVDVDKELTSEQRALGRSVRTMLEENTYWAMCYSRFIDNYNDYKKFLAPPSGGGIGFSVNMKMAQRKVRSMMEGHGIGRHSREEIYQIGNDDIAALSTLLGEKEYLLGDKPSTFDCAIFGIIANILWCGLETPLATYTKESAQNLVSHSERMKELCWPDWNDMVLGDKPEPALKKGFSFRRNKRAKAPKAKERESEKTQEEAPAANDEAQPTDEAPKEGDKVVEESKSSESEQKNSDEAKPSEAAE